MSTTDGFRADWAQKDFYAVLGVKKDATADEIKKAYRKLARANHPDSNPGDTAKHDTFKSVAEAYDVVGDTEKRKKYDEMRQLYGSGGGFGGGFGGGSQGGAGGFDLNDLLRDRGGAGAGGFGDMFGDLFGGRARQARPPSAEGLRRRDLSDHQLHRRHRRRHHLAAADLGRPLPRLQRHRRQARHQAPCLPRVRGRRVRRRLGRGRLLDQRDLPGCAAVASWSTTRRARPATATAGALSARSIQARIPAGVKDGQRIRLRGKGAAGENGGPAGDLFVSVKVSPHRIFGRTGDNLTLDVPVSFDELALGADVRIPTLGGQPVTLKVPAGTPDGRTFRVRGKGATKADGSKGDLLATVQVQVPAVLDQAAREAVEAYRAATAAKPKRANLFEEA